MTSRYDLISEHIIKSKTSIAFISEILILYERNMNKYNKAINSRESIFLRRAFLF